MHMLLLSLAACLALLSAWLPAERNLFNETDTYLPAGHGRLVKRILPPDKIRGVNLGSLFVMEPWMAGTEWTTMGCKAYKSEFDCVSGYNDQTAANAAFRAHWARWITEDDFTTMASYGINTVRIPVGYWMDESIVYSDSEHFPQGGISYLDQIVGWAKQNKLYVIIDLHGAPGAQVAKQPFTGQYASSAGFYQDYQYKRACTFLQFMTNRIHTNAAYSTVGMLEVLNEPISGQSTLTSTYYPNAYSAIRSTESSLGVAPTNQLHVQFMDKTWGSGDPTSSLPAGHTNVAFDNHRYLKYDTSVTKTQAGYHSASCNDAVAADGDTPLIVGEWSISPADDVQTSAAFETSDAANKAFYTKWWAAQVVAYEKQLGWVFWSWKQELNDYRWGYKEAVEVGVIPKDPTQAASLAAC